jgi:hypothetical protein
LVGAAALTVDTKAWMATILGGALAAAVVNGFAFYCWCAAMAAC